MIFVDRDSKKYILIGKKGLELKKVGTSARIEIEDFLRKQREFWRNQNRGRINHSLFERRY